MSVFAQIIPYGAFYKKDAAVEIVRQQIEDLRLQQRMLRLIELIPEKKSVLLAPGKMRRRKRQSDRAPLFF